MEHALCHFLICFGHWKLMNKSLKGAFQLWEWEDLRMSLVFWIRKRNRMWMEVNHNTTWKGEIKIQKKWVSVNCRSLSILLKQQSNEWDSHSLFQLFKHGFIGLEEKAKSINDDSWIKMKSTHCKFLYDYSWFLSEFYFLFFATFYRGLTFLMLVTWLFVENFFILYSIPILGKLRGRRKIPQGNLASLLWLWWKIWMKIRRKFIHLETPFKLKGEKFHCLLPYSWYSNGQFKSQFWRLWFLSWLYLI